MNSFLKQFDPGSPAGGCDRSRWHFVIFCAVMVAGLVYLYRDFIFSSRMFNSYDIINAGVFYRSFLVKYVTAFGKIPKWDPYIMCGIPYIDAIHGDIFYPLSFLKFFLPIPRAIGWTFIMHIFLAGMFAYAAARELRLSRTASGMVGAVYMFSGWLNSLVKPGHDSKFYVTALLPLLIFFVHRAFRRQPVLNYTMIGVVLGCIILSPHPQMAYFCLWTVAAYVLYSMITGFPVEGRLKFVALHSGLTAYAVLLGLLLGAVQFLPEFVYTRQDSPRTLYENNYAFAAGWSLHPEEAVSLFVPEFAGATIGMPGYLYWGRNYGKDNSEYAGLVALMLAILGVTYCVRRDKFFFAVLGGFALIYALGDTTPFFRYLYHIPFVKLTRAPSMIMFLFSFCVAMLAGMGIEALSRRMGSFAKGRYCLLNILVIAVPLALLAGWYIFAKAGEEALHLYARIWYPALFDDPGRLDAARVNLESIRSGFKIAFVLSGITAAFIYISRWPKIGLVILCLLPLLAAADGIRFDSRFVKTVDKSDEFRTTPLITFLQEHLDNYRTVGQGLDEIRLQLYYHGLQSPRGYHGNEPVWYYRLLSWGAAGVSANCINPRFSRLVGVKYFLSPEGMDFSGFGYGDKLSVVRNFDGISVVEDRGCYPRAFLAGKYRVITDLDSIFQSIYQGTDDLRRVVYVEREPDRIVDSISAPGDTAEIISYSPDSIVITAACAMPKILTISDTYFKDWHVYVDGREKESFRTYGAFRGVIVDSGKHTVVWKYKASMYAIGSKLTLAAMIFVFGLLAYALIRKRAGKPRFW